MSGATPFQAAVFACLLFYVTTSNATDCAHHPPARQNSIPVPALRVFVCRTAFAGVNYADVCIRWGLYKVGLILTTGSVCALNKDRRS